MYISRSSLSHLSDLFAFRKKNWIFARPDRGHNSREVPLCFLAPIGLQSHDKTLPRLSKAREQCVCVSVCVWSYVTIEPDSRTRQLSLSCVLLYEACSALCLSAGLMTSVVEFNPTQHTSSSHPRVIQKILKISRKKGNNNNKNGFWCLSALSNKAYFHKAKAILTGFEMT